MTFDFDSNKNTLTLPEYVDIEVTDFLRSPQYHKMMDGEAYYRADNETISHRQMLRYNDAGQPEVDTTRPNHKLRHGFMSLLVDDKINYLLTKPYSMTCDDETYLKAVQDVLGETFQQRLARVGTDASNKGISWMHPYIDRDGNFKLRLVPGDQGIPIWVDDEHTQLEAFIWVYQVEIFEGKERRWITKAEYWTTDRVVYYVRDDKLTPGGGFILDAERYLDTDLQEDEFVEQFRVGNDLSGWGVVPFVAFKNNEREMPDLQIIKSLIDEYDLVRSDVGNLLDEMKSTIFGLKGYGGENLGEFMRDMALYRAIKLDDDGGLDTYNPTIDIAAASEHYNTLRKDIYSFGGGVDKDSDKIGNSPSGIALKFIYSGLDLKCNKMETCFRTGLNNLLYFVNRYLQLTGTSVPADTDIEFLFNRDIAINESQAITDCQASTGIISQRTIVANHPWTKDVDEELKQIEDEKESTMGEDYSFGGAQDGAADEDGEVDGDKKQ